MSLWAAFNCFAVVAFGLTVIAGLTNNWLPLGSAAVFILGMFATVIAEAVKR